MGRTIQLALTALALAGCIGGSPQPQSAGPGAIGWTTGAAPQPKPGECWATAVSPAIIETVTEQTLLTPEQRDGSGALIAPARYSTTVRQNILRERGDIWFRAPCPEVQTPDFLASLQRALKARGYYTAPLTGTMDPATGSALRRFQAARGLDSAVLSLEAAQELGLSVVALKDL